MGELKQEYQASHDEEEIEFIQKVKGRSNLCEEVNGGSSKELLSFNVTTSLNGLNQVEVKKHDELTQISKIIHPNFKGQSTLYSHTQSTANKMKKEGKSAPQPQPELRKDDSKKAQ